MLTILSSAIRSFWQRLGAYNFYPTRKKDWFKLKGYKGSNAKEKFADFLAKQEIEGAPFYFEFKEVKLTRQYISSRDEILDSVIVKPKRKLPKRPGNGLFIVMMQGRGEYYESKFRDMAIQASATGASVISYNPKGFNSSSGRTKTLLDLVDDGIAVVNYLLAQGISHEKIILQGNSIGGLVIEMVDQYFRKNFQMRFHQINSNSLRYLAAVAVYVWHLPFLEKIAIRFFQFYDWDISPGEDFDIIGPYRMHLIREGDRTIHPKASYHSVVDYEKSYKLAPDYYKETLKWLYDNSRLIYKGTSKRDPHNLHLHEFQIPETDENGIHRSVCYLINKYIEAAFRKNSTSSNEK